MKSALVLFAAAAMVCLFGMSNIAGADGKNKSGEAEFKEHCAVCHPNGGNIMNTKKTLHKGDLDANNIKTATDIIMKMRNPGTGMTKFDTKTVSDSEAKKIAEYILKTFK
ncbi:MAG: c-type cytochrome [Nitrospirae bacterium]|nr:c-type cytochrome [Nitrospirota bacterium]